MEAIPTGIDVHRFRVAENLTRGTALSEKPGDRDVRGFWSDPEGTQRLCLARFRMSFFRVGSVLMGRGLRWVYLPDDGELWMPLDPAEMDAANRSLAELERLLGASVEREFRPVREEPLDPRAYGLYLYDAAMNMRVAGGEPNQPVDSWWFFIPRTPEQSSRAARALADHRRESGALLDLWRRKTGRKPTVKEIMEFERMLLSLGYPTVVDAEPEGASLEFLWDFQADGEPNLLLRLLSRSEAGGRKRLYLYPMLGVGGSPRPA
jgi:hypothetical protein